MAKNHFLQRKGEFIRKSLPRKSIPAENKRERERERESEDPVSIRWLKPQYVTYEGGKYEGLEMNPNGTGHHGCKPQPWLITISSEGRVSSSKNLFLGNHHQQKIGERERTQWVSDGWSPNMWLMREESMRGWKWIQMGQVIMVANLRDSLCVCVNAFFFSPIINSYSRIFSW